MPREDWELYVVGADGGEPRRLTYEIQHDIYPQFLSDGRLLAVMGEGRHRRSYLYDVVSGARTRLFHNNTLRTIAPEYEWVVRPDGQVIAIVSERDGDTVSPERGLYLTDLRQTVTGGEVLERVRDMATARARPAAAGHGDVRPDRSAGAGAHRRDLLRPDLRLRADALQLRLQARDPARQPAGGGVSGVDPPLVRLRARAPVVRALARRPVRQHGGDPARHRQSGGAVRGGQPFRFGEGRPRLRRQHLEHDRAAGGGPGHGPPAAGRHDPVRLVHLGGIGTPRQQGVRPPGDRGGGPRRRRAQQRHGRAG